MNDVKCKELIDQLVNNANENEIIEFKEAKNSFDFDKLGKYFSALSNEANLKHKKDAWLIFGVKDKPKMIIGTGYKKSGGLQQIKHDIATHTTKRITFIEIYEAQYLGVRIVLFQIPPAPLGLPIAWQGHYYGRDGESLHALNLEELERIRAQSGTRDWSSEVCPDATITDLDDEALAFARSNFKNKNPRLLNEIDNWDDITFLNKAKITIKDQITNTALLLLGKEESQHFLLPAISQITWILKDKNNIELDYQHFSMPLILNAERIAQRIRNLTYRYLPDNTLFPTEVTQYEAYVIREALNNCIAHQDYSLKERINLVEFPECLVFENAGSFIPVTIANVFEQDAPQKYYRNKFLCDAMVALNMIDTIGSGIKKMFMYQRERFFPLPDYEFINSKAVKVKIFGKIIDKNYTKLLINKTDLPIETVILLDQVQKSKPIEDVEAKKLKNMQLIEGRKPSYFVAAHVTEASGDRANYIKNKAFNDAYYKKMILAFLQQYSSATRKDIEDLLMDKLSDVLSNAQKKNKITNLLSILSKKDNLIMNSGSRTKPKWERKL
ncbi:MAG: ATP-dependent helicase RecG [Pseudomonadota bacterium]|nr:ATP-dependent helicase RecG [Pseudomonadota bacterium]